ncbi:hypothetical protein DE146DRAFT_762543 [Phaeosphaeria sp. MPI-PUGE-AT-0046c]|nr:hypothetical protein DE146DRAFT_762543 [Phaeosphaeria sp. MPI-PUGE-AT-0046c]
MHFGVTVLFCMDVAVNRIFGASLIRFHDDLFLHKELIENANASEVVEAFGMVLGIDTNKSKNGSGYSSNSEDAILSRMFPTGSIKTWNAESFGASDVPDSFFFLPKNFGGVNVKKPYIIFYVLKDWVLKNWVLKSPQSRLEHFH